MVRSIHFIRIVSLLLVGLLSAGCTSIFYYPRVQNTKFYDPQKIGLKHEEVEIQTPDGPKVHGWWFPASTSATKGTVVFFHGNAENITTHFLMLSWLPAEGYNYFIWDYPGYGVSEGEPTPENNVKAGAAVLTWLAKNKEDRPLIIYGQSLGGNIAMRTSLEVRDSIKLRTVIADGSFISYRSVARKKSSESWLLWILQPIAWLIMSDRYAPTEISKLSPTPLLVIHGQQDPVVAPQFGDDIFERAAEPKSIWKIPTGRHGDSFVVENRIYRKRLLEYLARLP